MNFQFFISLVPKTYIQFNLLFYFFFFCIRFSFSHDDINFKRILFIFHLLAALVDEFVYQTLWFFRIGGVCMRAHRTRNNRKYRMILSYFLTYIMTDTHRQKPFLIKSKMNHATEYFYFFFHFISLRNS